MRLMLFTHSYSPDSSPPQRRWGAFTGVLVKAGWDVDIITPEPSGFQSANKVKWPGSAGHIAKSDDGADIHRFRAPSWNRSWIGKLFSHMMAAVIMVPTSFAAPRPDIVLATVPALPTLFAAFLVSRIRRAPLVVEMRDAWPELIHESGIARWKWLEELSISAVRFVQCRAALVIAVSMGQESVLRRAGVSHSAVIPNGYDFKNATRVQRAPVPEPGEKLRVLYLGNVGESQGLEVAIGAASLASADIELRIVGAGTALERLKMLPAASAENVHFLEPVKGKMVREMYEWADTCLVSLRPDWDSFSYTVPSKLYELMALGCHVTGLVRGDAADIIERSETGVVLPQEASKLAQYWQSSRSREDIAMQSNPITYQNLMRYDLDFLGEKYSSILLDLVSKLKREDV